MYKLIKEEKLTVCTIDYKGNIKERNLEDFNFISKVSTTCIVGKDNDKRILEKNKYDILIKILDYYNVTQEELDIMGLEHWKSHEKGQAFREYMTSTDDNRKKQVGNVFKGMNSLHDVNRLFDGDIIGNHGQTDGKYIGIFESEGIDGGGKNNKNRIRFVDHPGISQFFPAYLRNKDKWDEFKGKWLIARQLDGIIKGNIDYNWYKKFENNEDNLNRECGQSNNNKDINITIDSKDQTITVNIKDKTKQRTIEDAWS